MTIVVTYFLIVVGLLVVGMGLSMVRGLWFFLKRDKRLSK